VKTFSQVQKLLTVSVNLNRTERWPKNRVIEMLDLITCQQIGKREDTMLWNRKKTEEKWGKFRTTVTNYARRNSTYLTQKLNLHPQVLHLLTWQGFNTNLQSQNTTNWYTEFWQFTDSLTVEKHTLSFPSPSTRQGVGTQNSQNSWFKCPCGKGMRLKIRELYLVSKVTNTEKILTKKSHHDDKNSFW
jgi:hypothetical protein